MEFHDLKEKLANLPKYPGTVRVEPGPMINEGYPSNFNLSFAWYEWTKKEGQQGPNRQYVSFADEMFYTKCQPCIRPQDWETIVANDESKYRYLSYFHMADVSGLIARIDSAYRKEIGIFAINSLINFFKSQNIDLQNIQESYCAGEEVKNLTAGKYTFDKKVEADPFYQNWIEAGIPPENMMPDTSRDTLLSLRNYSRPSPWGYRNEVYCRHQGKFLDIATIEHLVFEPVFDNEMNIINILDYRHAFSISAVGVERLLMVLNDYGDIRQIDVVAPLYELVRSKISDISDNDLDSLIQTIRPIQAIVTDGGQWHNLNSRRKEVARAFYMQFTEILGKYKVRLSNSLIKDVLSLNARLLKDEKMMVKIDDVVAEISERIMALVENKHLLQEQREHYRNVFASDNEY